MSSDITQMATDLLKLGYQQALNEISLSINFDGDTVSTLQVLSIIAGLSAKCETMTYESFRQDLLKATPDCK